MRDLVFDQIALDDLTWRIQNDRKIAIRIMSLIKEIQRTPFQGTGKPELLKHELSGCWSRRITREHRIVYQVFDGKIKINACRFHY